MNLVKIRSPFSKGWDGCIMCNYFSHVRANYGQNFSIGFNSSSSWERLCTKLFFKRYWIKSYAKWRNKSMISLLNVKKGVSLQLNVRHDISCIYTCPLPMLVKCGNLMNHRTSVACISYWYGLTLPWFRVSTYLLTGIE